MPLGFHVILRARDDRVIAPGPAARRRLARTFLTIGREHGLLAFNAADTHSHAELVCDRASAGRFARRVEISLVQSLGVDCGFQPAWFKPIHDQRHLAHTFRYILGQQRHHALGNDALHEGSNLPDLLGLRPLGAHTITAVREHLPRVQRAQLLELLGLPSLEPGPVSLDHLAEAAAAAAALPDLSGHGAGAVQARAAAVQVALQAHAPCAVAQALRISRQAVSKLGRRSVPAALLQAVWLQLALREARPEGSNLVAEAPALYVA